LNSLLLWWIWDLGSRHAGGNCCSEEYVVGMEEGMKLEGDFEMENY